METLDLDHKAMFKAANRPKRFQMILPHVLMSIGAYCVLMALCVDGFMKFIDGCSYLGSCKHS